MNQNNFPKKLIFFTVFLDLLGFGIVLPILPLLALDYGASIFAALSLQAIFSLTQMLFTPFWGRVSDHIGRRRVIVITALGMCVSYLAFGLAGTLWMLFLSRAVNGAFAANIAIVQALIADNTSEEGRAAGMGIVGAAIGLGFVFGPILAGVAAQLGDIRTPFYIAAGLCLANSLWAYAVLPKDNPLPMAKAAKQSIVTYLTQKGDLRFHLIFLFLVMFCFATIECSIVVLTKYRFDFDVSDNAFLFALFGFSLAFTQVTLVKPITHLIGDHYATLLGGTIMGIAALILSVTDNQVVFFSCVILFAVGDGVCFPSVMATISNYVSNERQGEIMGVTQSISAAARVIAPVIAGIVFDSIGAAYPYVFSAAIMILISSIGWVRLQNNVFKRNA